VKLIYLHGFNSAPSSRKAQQVRSHFERWGRLDELDIPALPHRPAEAIQMLCDLVQSGGCTALMGSSLGGYYATFLAERYRIPAVLINPAVKPYQLLTQHLGWQTNPYTGHRYELIDAHVSELTALEIDSLTASLYFLLTRTGDEVLDYRAAVQRYHGARQWVIPGGDHGFSDFDPYVEVALEFCGFKSIPK
jgi:hypothetical protein